MPFSVKDWKDYPDTSTPITAAALEDLESRVGAYAATISPGVIVAQVAGNGTTDDTTAIQTALDAARTAGGGTVVIPQASAAVCKVTAALKVGANTVFDLQGAKLSFATVGSSVDCIVNYNGASGDSNITIRNGRIVGPEDGTWNSGSLSDTGKGIRLQGGAGHVVENIDLSRFWLQGIQVDASTGARIVNNYVHEMHSGNGISLDDSAADCIIANNTVRQIADCAIGIHNGTTRTSIHGNTIDSTGFGRGIDVYGANRTTITGNSIYNTGAGTAGAAHGIWVAVTAGGTRPDYTVISGNIFETIADDGIQAWGDSATYTNGLVISGNHIYTCGTMGIQVALNVKGITVAANSISGATKGIAFVSNGGGTKLPRDCSLTGNTTLSCSQHDLYWNGVYTTIAHAGNYTTGTLYGI